MSDPGLPESSNGGAIPVDRRNWLKDFATPEEEKQRIFDTAYSARQEILARHYGEPLSRDYVLGIKRDLEKVATEEPGKELVIGLEDPNATEFYVINPTTHKNPDNSIRSEVRIYRTHVTEADAEDHSYYHEYPQVTSEELASIWLGETGTDE